MLTASATRLRGYETVDVAKLGERSPDVALRFPGEAMATATVSFKQGYERLSVGLRRMNAHCLGDSTGIACYWIEAAEMNQNFGLRGFTTLFG